VKAVLATRSSQIVVTIESPGNPAASNSAIIDVQAAAAR
jgi:hypothetical protein